MAETLWTLPVPSTALLGGGPSFEKRLGRVLALRFSFESDAGSERESSLVFADVEAFRVTYYRARAPSMLDAYDRLIDLGPTAWLQETSTNLKRNGADPAGLAHLMINFDDGPCYEVICRSFQVDGGA